MWLTDVSRWNNAGFGYTNNTFMGFDDTQNNPLMSRGSLESLTQHTSDLFILETDVNWSHLTTDSHL